jgi:hypothetical protein
MGRGREERTSEALSEQARGQRLVARRGVRLGARRGASRPKVPAGRRSALGASGLVALGHRTMALELAEDCAGAEMRGGGAGAVVVRRSRPASRNGFGSDTHGYEFRCHYLSHFISNSGTNIIKYGYKQIFRIRVRIRILTRFIA